MGVSQRPGVGETKKEGVIFFGWYNIFNVRKTCLWFSLRGMEHDNIELGVLQETKLIGGFYTRYLEGYKVL